MQTFSLLFLGHHWSNLTSNIVLIVSWALLLLELSIENFVLADPEKGPYYGITTSGYWCWISPKYLIERYTTDYLFMTASATFSLILYSLVFFRLRGNISVLAGYKISFHRRSKVSNVRFARTGDGAFVVTDDPRIECYVTTVAKHMLWYPIAYTVLILPVAVSRLSTFHGRPVPFAATMFTAAVFMLHGFLNTVLFCTTRNILPGSWRQKFGLGTRWDGGRGDADQSTVTDATCQFTHFTDPSTGSTGTVSTRPLPAVLRGHMRPEAEPSALYVGSSSPISLTSLTSSTSPTLLFQTYGGSGQRVNAQEHHIPQLSSHVPRGTETSIPFDVDEDDKDSDLSIGIHLAKTAEWVPQHSGRPSSDHESSVYGPGPV